MNELRLLFDTAADGDYSVRLANNWGGNAGEPLPFTPFLDDDDFENLRWYLEDFMDLPDGGAVVRARRIEGQLAEWGGRLHEAIFTSAPNQALLKQMLAGDDRGPRVLTVGTDDPRLLRLPWELIADAAGPLANRVSVRRQLAEPEKLQPRTITLPLRILYIVSRPADTGFLDPRLTSRSLLDALDPLGASIRVDFCRPPTLLRMQELLREADRAGDPYAIVHFDGHGTFIPEVQLGGLCFEKPDDGSAEAKLELVGADRLGALLAAHQIPLVVLEACRSAAMGETAVFRSIAPRLIQAGVASVLSMGHAVHVEAARRLLDRFYRELACGTTIGRAVAQARATLLAGPDRWLEYGPRARTVALQDWFLPHLYQRGLDEPLLPPAPAGAAAEPPRQFDLFLSHNHADSERVEWLARELDEKHALRVWLDKWECKPGPLQPQCERGITNSRYTVVIGSAAALRSKWVEWEVATALEHHPGGAKLLPAKFENITLSPELESLLWVDFTDPAKDESGARQLARLIRSTDADDARQRRGFRSPATHKDEIGAFPPAPLYGFQGRARELHQLERQFRTERGIVLHAMGGMGKSALATEAAQWWTRAGLFRDGACFLSFEQFASAERAIQVLGAYLEGPNFESLPASEQRRRAIELFNQRDVLVVWDNFESVLPQFQDDKVTGSDGDKVTNDTASSSPNHPITLSPTHPVTLSPTHSAYSADERSRLFDLFRELTASPSGKGRLLVTCRPGATGLPGAQKMELHGLARPDSLWLLARVIAKDRLTLDDPRLTKDKLDPLLQTLADHPLSIELVGPHLKQLTPESIIADFGPLLARFQVGAGVERNESLLASLAFSTRRLSEPAQAVLPWLGLFSGGVFEQVLLAVMQYDGLPRPSNPQESSATALEDRRTNWDAVRAELESTALVRVERDIQYGRDGGRPYLRFHPTLAYAARSLGLRPELAEQPLGTESQATVRQRFVQVYDALDTAVRQALRGSNSRGGLEVLAREEANFRTAVRWAVADQQYAVASAMGDTFGIYLQRSGRLRERDAWVTWLAAEVRKGGFSEALADRERDEAWTLFTQGQAAEAIRRLEDLRERLSATTEFDLAFQLALTNSMLGRVLDSSGRSNEAIPVLADAVAQWESLVDLCSARVSDPAGSPDRRSPDALEGLRSDEVARSETGHSAESDEVARSETGHSAGSTQGGEDERNEFRSTGEAERCNLSATLGDFANALRSAGRLDAALAAAERGLGIDRELGYAREVAAGLGRSAQIFMEQGRHAEADARYDDALAAARRAGDKELEGALLLHQGRLADDLRQYARAASLYQRALKLIQEMNDEANVMRTCNLLGLVEQKQGRLPEARTWYERSHEIAQRLGAVVELSQVAQNIGIVCQLEGEAARQQGREPEARRCFEDAKSSLRDSLRTKEQIGIKPDEALAWGALAQVHLLLGELDEAERHAHQAREIMDRLGLKEIYHPYNTLANIARARGDAAQAAEWEAKRDAVWEELQRRSAGPGGLPAQLVVTLQRLAIACAQAGVDGSELGPGEESALAQLAELPAPLSDLAGFLRQLAAGQTPAVPSALPAELHAYLTQLLTAVREAKP